MNEATPDPTPNPSPLTNPPPPEPPPLDPPLPDRPDFRTLFESLLRRPAALIARLGEPGHQAIGKLVLLAVISAIVFGAVLGTFAMHEQLWAAPLKITAGLAIATLICFPSLYIFASLAGARISVGHLAACLLGEGDQQDLPLVDRACRPRVRRPVAHHARLATTGTSTDKLDFRAHDKGSHPVSTPKSWKLS